MTEETTKTVLMALINTGQPIILSYIAFLISRKIFKTIYERNGKKLHLNIFQKIIEAFIWITCIASVGQQFSGFSTAVQTLLASSGIAALGISMAAQESLQNIIDGIMISMYRPFDIGDRITIPDKNITGNITEMNLRHTVITTYNNTKYIVSNNQMQNAVIENSSQNNNIAYPVDVSITYDSDIDKAIKVLSDTVYNNEYFVDKRTDEEKAAGKPPVTILVTGFGDYGINLRATVVQKDIGTSFIACSEIRRQIKKNFDAEGIGFPFQVITIDNLKDLKKIQVENVKEQKEQKEQEEQVAQK